MSDTRQARVSVIQIFFRLRMHHLLRSGCAVLCMVLVATGAAAAAARTFDPHPWLEDFAVLKAAMQERYANLAWFGSPSAAVDLRALERHTRRALLAAADAAEARRILLDFVAALGDGHFSPLDDDPPAGDARAEPEPARLDPADPASGCAALGYAARGRASFSLPFESLPGFRLEADGVTQGFRSGTLPVHSGARLGLVRIAEFRETSAAWACLDAWATLVKAGKSIDAASIRSASQQQWLRAMAEQLHRFASERVVAVVADIGSNGGGNDLADWLPRLFTDRPVHSAHMLLVRSPTAVGYLDEELTALREPLPASAGAAARAAVDRAVAGFEADKAALAVSDCDMSWVWREQRPWQPGSPCSHLLDVGSAAGALDYLEPHAFDNPDIAKRVYWAAVADDYRGAWTGPVYVITDSRSYSAAELFASSMQLNHIAKTVGQRTGGDGCGFVTEIPPLVLPHSRLSFRLPNCVRLRADGADEVAGVAPDLPVTPLKGESLRARAARVADVIAADVQNAAR
jgi:Peptidase family S41